MPLQSNLVILITAIVLVFLFFFTLIFRRNFKKGYQKNEKTENSNIVHNSRTNNENLQVVAVITAALLEYEGSQISNLRITNIEPVYAGFNTPIWGHIERLVKRFQENRKIFNK